MKHLYYHLFSFPLFFTLTFFIACNGQEKPRETNQAIQEAFSLARPSSAPQIADYIRNIFQDKNGKLWFGTNGYGVAHYDGDSLSYFSNTEGFGGQQITAISEDLEKNIWFATDQGIVKYDWSSNAKGEKQFTNYTDERYFGGLQFWSIFADRKGTIWGGSSRGIFRFDGVNWTPFPLPYPKKISGEFITSATSWSIIEDSMGNMWFSTNGYGVFKYDGQSFTQYSKKDGLSDNSVDQILEDRNGIIWFGTRFGGLSRFDGKQFVNYTQKNQHIGNDEVCVVYEDRAGNIWFSSEGYGVYRYDGTSLPDGKAHFINFSEKHGLGVRAVQTIFEDREGRLWVGGGGGLYRYDEKSLPDDKSVFFNVTKNGPWE